MESKKQGLQQTEVTARQSYITCLEWKDFLGAGNMKRIQSNQAPLPDSSWRETIPSSQLWLVTFEEIGHYHLMASLPSSHVQESCIYSGSRRSTTNTDYRICK